MNKIANESLNYLLLKFQIFLNLIRILEYTLEVLTRYNGVDSRNTKQVLRWKRLPICLRASQRGG